LRAIDGFSSLLHSKVQQQDDAESQHYLTLIRDNIARMSALINDLLAFARCGRETIQREDLDMEALAKDALQQIRATYPGTVIDVSMDSLPDARGDAALIRQVWLNLLDNAVKYSARVKQPRITITGREEQDRVVFEIADNGVGFDTRYSDKLFLVFHRLHGSEYSGSGVGLAIVQRIVARHGGEVWARSTLGQGSTFSFSLALNEMTSSDAQLSTAVEDISE
jgi:light-regulated signal transduction histidine kinase (bacteriophytochrome)